MATELFAVGLVIFATFIGAFGALALKYGANKMTRKNKLSFLNIRLLIGISLYGLSSIFFLIGLKYGDLSVLYPITSLSYIWISLLSIKMLKEKMNFFKWMGVLSILVGVTLIGFGS
ncbi:hypothetical protein COV16_02710 [Candidatus Woesearchaeota archaeon CG10_big_fil_rev_8_21_14_0_10_34_8]|nr:MAG: hypothetical protein COV16_02710 [Candidatus Woesearchaeota archaeon CG10_big_fil_rev_8_21_14_0_10_34_8]